MPARTPGLPWALLPPQLQLPWRGHQDLEGKHRPLHPVTTPAQALATSEGPQPGLHVGQPAETPALLPLLFLGSCHLHFRNHGAPVFRFKSFVSLVQGSLGSALPHPAQPPRLPATPSSPFYIPSWRPAACPQLPPDRASAQISAPGGSLPRQPLARLAAPFACPMARTLHGVSACLLHQTVRSVSASSVFLRSVSASLVPRAG